MKGCRNTRDPALLVPLEPAAQKLAACGRVCKQSPQAAVISLFCCSPTMLCLPVTLCPARGGQQHMTDPRAQFPAHSSSSQLGSRWLSPATVPSQALFSLAAFSLPPWGFILRPGMMVTSPPRNQQAVAFPLRAESEAAGSKSLCHGADGARRLLCHTALLRAVSRGFPWTHCRNVT